MREEGIKRMMEGVNSTMIYCKTFCKCNNIPKQNNNKKFLNVFNLKNKRSVDCS
jgi:hypothetical protein